MAVQSKCPHCGIGLREGETGPQEGDIICVKCGMNLLTGQKVARQDEFVPPRRSSGSRLMPALIALAVVVVLLVGGAFAALVLFQDPVAEAAELGRANNVLQAIDVLREHLNENPNDAEAHLLLGKLYWKGQQYDSAVDAFQQASELAPNEEQPALLTVAAAQALRDDSARQRQVQALERLTTNHPGNSRAWLLLALARGAQGEYAAQAEALSRAEAAGANEAEVQAYQALAQALAGDWTGVGDEIGVAALQGDETALAARGVIEELEGNTDTAVQYLEEAIAEGTGVDAALQTRLGLIYLNRGEFERALQVLQQAYEAEEAPPSAAFFYAVALQEAGLEAEARRIYENIVALGRGEYAGQAALQLALIQTANGDFTDAQESIRRATQLGAPTARLRTMQGMVYSLSNQPQEAQTAFREAIRANPDYAPAYLESGLLYLRQGVLSEGLRALRSYLEHTPPGVGRRAEIEVLVNQLEQTAQEPAGAAG